MKISDILTDEDLGEVYDVPNERYPYTQGSTAYLTGEAKEEIEELEPTKRTSQYEIYDLGRQIIIAVGGNPVGEMLLPVRAPHQVSNVFILPEHRNQKLGLAIYNYVLKDRGEDFAVNAAQTPFSQRLWCSLWRDPELDVYALDREGNRHEVKPMNGRLESDTTEVWGTLTKLVATRK